MMMVMGGAVLVAIVLPFVAIGVVVLAVIGHMTGRSPGLLEQLLPPATPAIRAVTDPTPRRAQERRVDYTPLGMRQIQAEDAAEALTYVRTCHECGAVFQHRYDACPSCGAKLYWE